MKFQKALMATTVALLVVLAPMKKAHAWGDDDPRQERFANYVVNNSGGPTIIDALKVLFFGKNAAPAVVKVQEKSEVKDVKASPTSQSSGMTVVPEQPKSFVAGDEMRMPGGSVLELK